MIRMKTLAIVAAIAALAGAEPAAANLVHVVTFRYKPGTTAAQREDLARRIRALVITSLRNGKPYIVSIRGGAPISREGFDQGFEQMFLVEFRDGTDRNYFIGPPYGGKMEVNHRKVVDDLLPLIERDASGRVTGSFVYDFADGG